MTGVVLAGDVVLLTPWAGLVAFAFVVPLGALVARERRAGRLRATLGLAAPARRHAVLRAAGLVAVAALVGATAAQPAVRDVGGEEMRTDAELYITFDVSRSMLATRSPGERNRLDRAISVAHRLHAGLSGVPTGVATVTTRMMPLLFPIPDGRGVSVVLDRSVAIAQPAPSRLTTPRATQLGAISLAAHRTYFSRSARLRALVVLSDLDTDEFGLDGTLTALHRNRIEPFFVRIASPGERIFDAHGRPENYRSTSTLAVSRLRRAGWHAYEETETDRLLRELRLYLGTGPTQPSGVVESQRNVAPLVALAALGVVALLTMPSLVAGARSVRSYRATGA